MPQRIISLDIGDTELKAAVVQTSFRDFKVASFFEVPLAPGTSPAAQVKHFLEQHAAEDDTILTTLPGHRLAWRMLFLPFRDAKRLAQTVPFELESYVPFGLDEVVVDYAVVRRDRAGTTVLAVLVQRSDLEHHLAALGESGIDPKIVGCGPLATLNTLGLVPNLPPTFAFVDCGPHTTTAALYRDRELCGLRSITRPLPPPATNGSGAPLGAEETARAIAALATEVRWTLLAMNGAPIDDPLPCYIAGPAALADAVAPALAEALPLEMHRLDRMPLRHVDPALGAQAPAFSASLGLALREAAPGNALGVNFRRGEFAFRRAHQEIRQALRGVMILALVVVALTLVDLAVKRFQLARHADAIDAQIQEVFHATLPDLGRVANPKTVLQEETDALRQRLDVLRDIVPVSSSTSIDILRAAASAVPNKIRIDCEEYMMDPDAVRVRCNSDTYESVDTIKHDLLQTGFFADVEVKDVKQAVKGSGVDFRMTLKLNKDARPGGGRR